MKIFLPDHEVGKLLNSQSSPQRFEECTVQCKGICVLIFHVYEAKHCESANMTMFIT